MKKIYALGEALIDFTAGQTEADKNAFYKNAGGAPANVAACVAKLGGKSCVITKLGKDMFGEFLKLTLEKAGVNTDYVYFTGEANTALAFVSLGENGEREFTFYRSPSADMLLSDDDVKNIVFDKTDVLHFGSVDLIDAPVRGAHDALIKKARDSGAVISFDPNLRYSLWKDKNILLQTVREYIPLADIIKVSDDELRDITGIADDKTAIKSLFKGEVKLVIVTKGARGAIAFTQKSDVFVPSVKVEKAVDTTGAGDSFIGAVLYQLVKNGFNTTESELKKILTYANKTAAFVVCGTGAIPSMPDRAQVFEEL